MNDDTPASPLGTGTTKSDAAIFFETLFSDTDTGFVSISVKVVDGSWRDDYATAALSEIQPLIERLGNAQQDKDVYLTVAPRKTAARGTGANTESVVALWIELDSAESSDGKRMNPGLYFATLDEAKKFVANSAPWDPTMIVNSGHGWHFYWKLNEPLTEGFEELLAAWRGFWEAKADAAGKRLDPVFDSPRVMRVPGTWNMKGEPLKVTVVEADPSRRYEASDILDVIPLEDRRRASTYASSLADSAEVNDWIKARSHGWDRPGKEFIDDVLEQMREATERHPTAKALLASILQDARSGVDYGEAIELLREEFDRRVLGEDRSAYEFDDLVVWVVSQRIAEGISIVPNGLSGDPREGAISVVDAETPIGRSRAVGSTDPGSVLPSGLRLYRHGDLGGYIDSPSHAVMVGPIGEWLTLIEPETETSLAALGAGALAVLGSWLGPHVSMSVGRIEHHTNLFTVVVGPSSYSRKGTASAEIRSLMRSVDRSFVDDNYASGFGSGEAIIDRIRDAEYDSEGVLMRGVVDHRLFVEESEYARVLRVSGRQGSILSDILRLAFDGGRRLENITKGSKVTSTSHHVSMFGSITPEELTTLFTAVAAVNGAGNRNLWVWSNEKKLLPEGGIQVNVEHAVAVIRRTSRSGSIRFERSSEAAEWWNTHYERLRNLEHVSEKIRPIVSRSTDQVQRIALIYAATEGAAAVDVGHLEAGLAWVEHSIATVSSVLGELVADEIAGKILGSLRRHPGRPVTRVELHNLFNRHHSSAELSAAIDSMVDAGLAYRWTGEPDGGRPPEMLVATTQTKKG